MRTNTEIYESMLIDKGLTTQLDDLSDNSNLSLWKLMLSTISVALSYQTQLFDLLKEEVEHIRINTPIMTLGRWRYELTDNYQFNIDNDKGVLIEENLEYKYAIEDEASKIIDYASVTESSGTKTVNIKVAKSELGLPIPLTNDELLSLEEFVSKRKVAGTKTNIVSLESDNCAVHADVYIDAGYVATEVQAEILTALQNYFERLSNLNFTGTVSKTKIINVIEAVVGVQDVNSTNFFLKCKADADTTYRDIEVKYNTVSGYVYLDTNFTIINIF